MNEALSSAVDQLANLMLVHLVQLTVVSLIAWAGVCLFARNRPHLAHTLWLLVIIKAITPPIATTNIGLFPWLERTVITVTRKLDSNSLDKVDQRTPPSKAQNEIYQPIPAVNPSTVSGHGHNNFTAIDERTPQTLLPTKVTSQIVALPSEKNDVRNEHNDVKQSEKSPLLLIAWLAGSVTCFSLIVFRAKRAIARIKATREPIPQWLADRMKDHSARTGIEPRLWLTSSNFGPVAFGVLRPTIAIPNSLIESDRRSALSRDVDTILAHELAHLRRHDLLVGWIQVVAQSIWWFHPLVWMVNRNLSRESERCCDEEAVGRLGCPASVYLKGLLNVLEAKRSLQAVPVHPGIRQVDVTRKRLERIISLKNGYRTRTPAWCGLFLLAASAFCIPGAASNAFTERAMADAPKNFKLTPMRGPTGDQMPDERIRLSVQLISGPSAEVDDLFSNWKVKPFQDSKAPVFLKSSGQSIRKQSPVLWSPITKKQHQQIIDAAQSNARINVHAAVDTVRGTQSLRLADMTQHPFVVGMENEPVVSTIDSGFAIELIPSLIGTDDVRIQFNVELTRILEVERLTITRPGQSATSIQVPKVARSDSAGRPTINLEETLLIGGIRHLSAGDKNDSADATNRPAMIIAVKATVLGQSHANEFYSEIEPVERVSMHSIPDQESTRHPDDLVTHISDAPDAFIGQTVDAAPWDLSRIGCLRIALGRSRETASFGSFVPGEGNAVGSIHLTREKPQTRAEIATRDLVREIEKAYWELHFYYRNLDAAKVGRDSALLTWRSINAQLQDVSGRQADAASVAQSQEQYFFFRGRVEEAKRDLTKGERHLRFLCGIAGNDGRTIRPIDDPDYSKANVEWELLLAATVLGAPQTQQTKMLVQTVTKRLAAATSTAERRKLEALLKTLVGKLEDVELELSHMLSDDVQNLDSCHNLMETAAKQSLAAKKQVDARRAQFKEGTVSVDFLLDAQRRLADSRVAYYRSLTEYEMAKLKVAYRSNSLLSDRKLTIHEPVSD